MKALELQIENLEKMRSRWLLINLIGFILWDGFRIFNDHLIQGGLPNSLKLISITGWLIWTLGLVQIYRIGQKVKKTKMASEILNDELIELIRLKSWRLGFIAVLSTQVIIVILSSFSFEISGILAAEVSIFVAVTTAISAFIYYDNSFSNG